MWRMCFPKRKVTTGCHLDHRGFFSRKSRSGLLHHPPGRPDEQCGNRDNHNFLAFRVLSKVNPIRHVTLTFRESRHQDSIKISEDACSSVRSFWWVSLQTNHMLISHKKSQPALEGGPSMSRVASKQETQHHVVSILPVNFHLAQHIVSCPQQ